MQYDQHRSQPIASAGNKAEASADDPEKPLLVFNGIWKNGSSSGYWLNGMDGSAFKPAGEIVSLRGISDFSRLQVLLAGKKWVVISVGDCLYSGARVRKCAQ